MILINKPNKVVFAKPRLSLKIEARTVNSQTEINILHAAKSDSHIYTTPPNVSVIAKAIIQRVVINKQLSGRIIDVIDNLTTLDSNAALSANMGVELAQLIADSIVEIVDNLTSTDAAKALSAKQGKELKGLIDSSVVAIVDNLTSTDATKALSAKQGKELKGLIDSSVVTIVDNLTSTDAAKALSARQGKTLNDLINAVVNTYFNPQNSIYFHDDFNNANLWQASVLQGTATDNQTTNALSGENGIRTLTVSSNPSARGLAYGGGNTGFGSVTSDVDINIWCKVRIPALSTSTDEFSVYIGLLIFGANDENNGIYFRYLRTNGGNFWQCVTGNSGIRTITTTSVPINANEYYRLRFTRIGSTITFFIARISGLTIVEQQVAQHTTNIPAVSLNHTIGLRKTAGVTANTAIFDYYGFKLDFITLRL